MTIRTPLAALLVLLGGCTESEFAPVSPDAGHAFDTLEQPVSWSDGDSGTLESVRLRFRLPDVDAPETGGVGTRNGARCEAERAHGLRAKQFMIDATAGADVRLGQSFGADRYGREVVTLIVDGRDIRELGLEAGMLRAWPFDQATARALTDKPNWC